MRAERRADRTVRAESETLSVMSIVLLLLACPSPDELKALKKQLTSGVAANGSVDLITLEAVKVIVRRVGAENAKRLIDILA